MPTPPPPKPDLTSRFAAGVLALGILAVLSTAAFLTPDQRGHGTHESLGLPECGWIVAFDRPCPTCGMTTAFAHAAEGQYLTAFQTQPMGTLLALTAATLFWAFASIALRATNLWPEIALLTNPRAVWTAVTALALAWAYTFLTWPAT